MASEQNFKILAYENESERDQWRTIYNLFKEIDVLYLPEYGKLFYLHGDGEPFLFVYYQSEKDIVIYPFLKRSLRQVSGLQDLEKNLFDITSPYGYGGYLPSSSKVNMGKFFSCFHNYCHDNNIISEFVRFHPILENIKYVLENINIKFANETIYMDLNDEIENIWHNMAPRCRNAIRKAIKNDVRIIWDKDFSNIDIFINLYKETMNRLGAGKYYFFTTNWFYNLIKLLKNNVALFHASYKGNIISSALFTYNKNIINYFLTGALQEMRHLSVNNLLLYEVSLWARRMGIRFFHLGGGYRLNDSLYLFKKSFSSLRKQYFIGNVIHDQQNYEYICNLKYQNKNYDNRINFFPLYRYSNDADLL
jgi:hypothetical protein